MRKVKEKIMASKTMGDYMRMMKSVEKKEKEEEQVEESQCNCDGTKPCDCPSDCECGCNKVTESIDGNEIDLSESMQFLSKVKAHISIVNDMVREGISGYINDGDDYECDSYMIMGYTLESGMVVVFKCKNEYDEYLNAYFEVRMEDVEFKGFV